MNLVDLVALNAQRCGALLNDDLHLSKPRCLGDHFDSHLLCEGENSRVTILNIAQEVGCIDELGEAVRVHQHSYEIRMVALVLTDEICGEGCVRELELALQHQQARVGGRDVGLDLVQLRLLSIVSGLSGVKLGLNLVQRALGAS